MTGSVFVCRLIIPYGRDKANYWVYDAPKKVKYQFPMGKVKSEEMNKLLEERIVSIPYGKGKAATNAEKSWLTYVSIPYGKGKA